MHIRRLAWLTLFGAFSAPMALGQDISFSDLAGREVILSEPAERIISIVVPPASTVVSIDGSADRLVGVNPIALDAFKTGIISTIYPQVLEIDTSIVQDGGGIFAPSVESIAALRPDIVIQSGFSGEDIVQPLLNAGLNTALYQWGTEEQARQVNVMIGAIVGKPERAAALNQWRADTIATIEGNAAGVTRPVRAVQIAPSEGGFRVWGDNTIADFAIEMAGAVNVASGMAGIGVVSLEQLMAWNPEVVFIMNSGNTRRSEILDHPLLGALEAARSGRVYILPSGSMTWGATGEDDPLFFSFVAAMLAPEHHSYDVVADMQNWFQFMYGRQLTASEVSQVFVLSENSAAANIDAIGAIR